MPSNTVKLPDCANWKLWLGKEIEGDRDVGQLTLFVRDTPWELSGDSHKDFDDLMLSTRHHVIRGSVSRIWFCEQFRNYEIMREAISRGFKVCVELTLRNMVLQPDILDKATIYVKLPLQLKEGDFVCIGRPYRDEAFRIGTGTKVTPEQYAEDIFIM